MFEDKPQKLSDESITFDDKAKKQRVSSVIDFFDRLISRDDKNVYKFQIVWDPAQHLKKGLKKNLSHQVLITPYQGELMSHLHLRELCLIQSSPLCKAVEEVRDELGIRIATGVWKKWKKPLAILFDTRNISFERVQIILRKLKRDVGIELPENGGHFTSRVVFGYVVAKFLVHFEAMTMIELSIRSRVLFNDWDTAPALLFFSYLSWYPTMRTTLCFHRTSLGDLVPKTAVLAAQLAKELDVFHQFEIERHAYVRAKEVLVVRPLNKNTVAHQMQFERDASIRYFKAHTPPLKSFFRSSRRKVIERMKKQMEARKKTYYPEN